MFHSIVGSNGIRFVHVPWSDPRAHVLAYFRVGSISEQGFPSGVAHFLEHMMFRGSKDYPKASLINHKCDQLGGGVNAATSYDSTEYTFSGTKDFVLDAVDFLASVLREPLYLDLAKERDIILREYEDEHNEFQENTDITFQLFKNFMPGTVYENPILGHEESIKRMSLEDLAGFREKFYGSDNLTVIVVSDHKSDLVFSRLEDAFRAYPLQKGHLFKDPNPLDFLGPKVHQVKNTDFQTQVLLSFRGPGEDAVNPLILSLISEMLTGGFSSALNKQVREEMGLVYDISSDYVGFDTFGQFEIHFSATEDCIEKIHKEVLGVLAKIRSEGLCQEYFAIVKTKLKMSLDLIQCSPSSVAFQLAAHFAKGKVYVPEEKVAWLENVSIEEVQKHFNQIFTKENLACTLFGNLAPDRVEKIGKIWKKF